jgi:hypothetical protein
MGFPPGFGFLEQGFGIQRDELGYVSNRTSPQFLAKPPRFAFLLALKVTPDQIADVFTGRTVESRTADTLVNEML